MSQTYLRPLGHIPSKSDPRDFQHPRYSLTSATPIPSTYKVPFQSPITDQGDTPTCVGHAMIGLLGQMLLAKGITRPLSALSVYVGARSLENPVPSEGTSIRDALIFAQRFGVSLLADWPWLSGKGLPNPQAAIHALMTRVGGWAVVTNTVQDIKAALLRTKSNLIAALDVTPGFDQPGPDNVMRAGGDSRGSHGVNICGFSDELQCFLIRNSWGTGWADGGYAWRPYTMYFTEIYTATLANLDQLPPQDLWHQILAIFGIH